MIMPSNCTTFFHHSWDFSFVMASWVWFFCYSVCLVSILSFTAMSLHGGFWVLLVIIFLIRVFTGVLLSPFCEFPFVIMVHSCLYVVMIHLDMIFIDGYRLHTWFGSGFLHVGKIGT